MKNWNWRKILGIAMLSSILIGFIIWTCVVAGVVPGLLMWGASLLLAGIIVVAVFLIID